MLVGIGLAFGPGIVVGVIPKLLNFAAPGAITTGIAVLTVPAMPAFYIYAIYQRYLGELEFRANRAMGLYGFTLLYATAFVLVSLVGYRWLRLPEKLMLFSLAVSTLFVIAAPPLRDRFQLLVDRLAYGIRHNPRAFS